MEIIELDNMAAIKEHGNLYDTAPAWIQRMFGNNLNHIYQGVECGTVVLKNGDSVDYWRNNQGKFEYHKAV